MAYEAFHQALAVARDPTQENSLSPEQRKRLYEDLCSGPTYGLDEKQLAELQRCLDRVRSKIESQQAEEKADRWHQELLGVGKKTLTGTEKTVFWARLAVLAAVIVPVGLYLISDLYSSNTLRARRKKASSQPYRQTPAPIAASQEPEASSSTSTPSLEQTAIAQPSASPLEPSDTPPKD